MDEASDSPGPPDGSAEDAADGDPTDAIGGDRDPSPGPSSDLSAREEAALRRVRRMSRLLDEAIRVPGTDVRVGLDPILGIAPVGGDAIAAVVSLYPAVEAYRLGASKGTLAKMLALVAVDAVVGSVPVVGTLFDAFWKANSWNRRTLERHVRGD
jgi:hypothetical protein